MWAEAVERGCIRNRKAVFEESQDRDRSTASLVHFQSEFQRANRNEVNPNRSEGDEPTSRPPPNPDDGLFAPSARYPKRIRGYAGSGKRPSGKDDWRGGGGSRVERMGEGDERDGKRRGDRVRELVEGWWRRWGRKGFDDGYGPVWGCAHQRSSGRRGRRFGRGMEDHCEISERRLGGFS